MLPSPPRLRRSPGRSMLEHAEPHPRQARLSGAQLQRVGNRHNKKWIQTHGVESVPTATSASSNISRFLGGQGTRRASPDPPTLVKITLRRQHTPPSLYLTSSNGDRPLVSRSENSTGVPTGYSPAASGRRTATGERYGLARDQGSVKTPVPPPPGEYSSSGHDHRRDLAPRRLEALSPVPPSGRA